jgi:predicted nucleotidyltransferase
MKRRPRVRALKLAAEVRKRLVETLNQPVIVILYGSQARGDSTKYSDVDLLIILPVVNEYTRKTVSNITWEVGFEAGKVVSGIPTTPEEMKYYAVLPFYRNIQKEGIAV